MSISRFLVSFRWVFFWGASTSALGLLLVLGLGFNLETSPGWQLALYYLMLFVFVLGPVITAVPSALPLFPGAAGRVDWLMVALFAFVMAGVLLFGWLRGGSYESLRDHRLLPLSVLFVFGAIAVVFVVGMLRIGRQLFLRLKLGRWESPGPRWLDQSDSSGKGKVCEMPGC